MQVNYKDTFLLETGIEQWEHLEKNQQFHRKKLQNETQMLFQYNRFEITRYNYVGDFSAKLEDPNQKPALSYIALISMAIVSHPEKKMLLGDIYQHIMDK